MSAQPVARFTTEEYLAADRAALFRSEYYNGCVYAMSGGSFVHAQLIGNIISELNGALGNRPCIAAPSDARVAVSATGPFVYPDVVVVCGPVQFGDRRQDTVLNPSMIVEVLSASTEAHDRGAKFAYYREIESLQEYLLVSQTAARLELFRRKANGIWELSDHVGLAAVVRLDSIDAEISLAGIYKKVELPPEETPLAL